MLRRRATLPLLALPLVGALLAGCSGGGSGGSTSSPDRPKASASGSTSAAAGTGGGNSLQPKAVRPAAQAGCGLPAARHTKPGFTLHSVKAGGVVRKFLLDVPAASTRSTVPLPLVIDYHGYNQTALQQEAYTKLGAQGMATGYVVVTPQGVNNRWNFVRRAAVGPDDVAFTATMLATIEKTTCVDQNRIFATGMSDGADMANTVACALPTRIAAVAPVAASVIPTGCAGRLPSSLEIHGTADPVVPYGGGGGDRAAPFNGTVAQPVETRVAAWAKAAGCGKVSVWRPSTPNTRYLSYPGCPGRDVGLLAVNGGGHTWPGAAPVPSLGATNNEISADEVILLFFKGHPRSTS